VLRLQIQAPIQPMAEETVVGATGQ
jgi:hypothetical protein